MLSGYPVQDNLWDEMYSKKGIRQSYSKFVSAVEKLSPDEFAGKSDLAKKLFMTQGYTGTPWR